MRKLYPVFITVSLFIAACTAYFNLSQDKYSHRVPFIVPTKEKKMMRKMAMMGLKPVPSKNLTGQLTRPWVMFHIQRLNSALHTHII